VDVSTSRLETAFLLSCRLRGLPEPIREFRFAAVAVGGTGAGVRGRLRVCGLADWRFDFAWPDRLVAVEIDGGVWSRGRHTRGAGYIEDRRKLNRAVQLGWRVVGFTGHAGADAEAWTILEGLLR
jgi:hypothetical protein